MTSTQGVSRSNTGGARIALIVGAMLAGCGLLQVRLASAEAQLLDDGAQQHASGEWVLPQNGYCPEDLARTTLPDCLALRLPAYTASLACTLGGTRSWSYGVCNDTVHNTDQATCEAMPGRRWSNGVCAVTMQGADRLQVSCTQEFSGTWVTSGTCIGQWVMPGATTYSPPLMTGTALSYPNNPGPGDQCLRCHTSTTEWNTIRSMDVESFLATGHKTPLTGMGSFSCSRCHGSAVENAGDGTCSLANLFTQEACTAAGGAWRPGLPYPVPLARSSHHGDLTYAEAWGGGYCSDTRLRFPNAAASNPTSYLAKLQCEYVGGRWYAQCSDPAWPTQAQCQAAAGCSNPMYTTASSCTSHGQCSVPFFTTEATCTAGAGSWTAINTWSAKTPGSWTVAFSCSLGTCSDASATTPDACAALGATWTNRWNDPYSCRDAGGTWTGSKHRRGQLITALCMECHRQDFNGVPLDTTNPATAIKVGPTNGTVDFLGMAQGNQFLNSPHAQFTGPFAEIGSATRETGYGSDFLLQGLTAKTGNGCTGCHEVHRSTRPEANPNGGAIRRECAECHASINLATIGHLAGAGTPLEHKNTDPNESCRICHMPNGEHLFRINSDVSYTSLPAAAMTTTANANTAPDKTYPQAVWVDLDNACGQCHGGGLGQASSVGTIGAVSNVLTVADGTGFLSGQRIRVTGAGSLKADGVTRGDFMTYIASASGRTLVLAGNGPAGVVNTTVVQNPTRNGAMYRSRDRLNLVAKDMHQLAAVSYPVTFSYKIGSPNTLGVTVDAVVECGGVCPALTYEWDWGDGTAHGSLDPDAHTYNSGGTKSVTLVVRLASSNGKVGTVTRSLTLPNPDLPPVVAGTYTWHANTWTMSVVDATTDDGSDADILPGDGDSTVNVNVNWGDGSTRSFGAVGTTFTHLYALPGTYSITHSAIDAKLQASSQTSPTLATPAYFVISGTVYRSNGSTPVPSALVTVRKAGTAAKSVYTAANGTFSAGSLKPGTYTLTITKTGYTFANPAATITVGPSGTNTIIKSITP